MPQSTQAELAILHYLQSFTAVRMRKNNIFVSRSYKAVTDYTSSHLWPDNPDYLSSTCLYATEKLYYIFID